MNVFRGDQRDWKDQYAAVGQFVVEFEWICWHLRKLGNGLLLRHGLKKESLGEVVFNQRVFTAEPLFACCESLVAEALGSDHILLEEIARIRNEFQDLCKIRNDLLHASYLIGSDVVEVTDRDTASDVHVEKRTPDRKGARVQILANRTEVLVRYVAQATAIKEKVKGLVPRVFMVLHRGA